jgi:hypothetical protein
MRFVAHLALVAETTSVSFPDLTQVSAALQKHITRDLSSVWDLQGTVDAFARLNDVPLGYWPIIIRDEIGQDASGVHCDDTGQPIRHDPDRRYFPSGQDGRSSFFQC